MQGGTTGEDYVNAQVKEKGLKIEVVSYEDLAALQQALATNQIVAAVNDLPVWNEYIKANPGKVVVAAGFDTGEQYGFAVKKGNARAAQDRQRGPRGGARRRQVRQDLHDTGSARSRPTDRRREAEPHAGGTDRPRSPATSSSPW